MQWKNRFRVEGVGCTLDGSVIRKAEEDEGQGTWHWSCSQKEAPGISPSFLPLFSLVRPVPLLLFHPVSPCLVPLPYCP